MIKARMRWKDLKLELTGHAGAGVKGTDLVCCAVSVLTTALVNTLEDMEKEGMAQGEWTGRPDGGYMLIEADPARGREAEVRAAFRVCVTGLRSIEEEYADYLELREDR